MAGKVQKQIDMELTELKKRLVDTQKYRMCYLGGGDFLVHVMGIDLAIDETVIAIESVEVDDE